MVALAARPVPVLLRLPGAAGRTLGPVLRRSRGSVAAATIRPAGRLGGSREQRARLPRPRHAGDGKWQRRHVVGMGAAVLVPEPRDDRLCHRSLLDRKRTRYDRLAFWLRMIVRYYIATAALSYGIIKLFRLQMPFPSMSQLATPLGDLLPMRFSWLFIGYSAPYQFFSGAMETLAGLLLLYRRTVTAGLFAASSARRKRQANSRCDA